MNTKIGMPRKDLIHVYLVLLVVMVFWGGTFVAGRMVSFEVKPLTAAFWRFILAALILVPLTLKREGNILPKGLTKKEWLILPLLGATGMFGYSYFFIKGLNLDPAGRASVIVALDPSFTFIGTLIFFGEKLTLRSVGGFLLALFGAVIVITHGRVWDVFQGDIGWGDFYILTCALCWAAYSLLGKVILGRLTPLMSTTWACIFGILLLMPFAFIESGPAAVLAFSQRSWLSLAFLGVFGTSLCFTLYYYGIVKIGPEKAAVFVNLVPVFGIISGWLILNEQIDLSLILGLVLVLSGIALIQRH